VDQGHLVRLWKSHVAPGETKVLGLYRADSEAGLNALLGALPLDVLRLTDVRPFRDLVRAGIPVVMMNHIRYTALDRNLPASLSPKAYGLLRDLGFEGVAITDSLGMGAVNLTWGFYDAAPMAIAAGADGLLGTDGFFAEEMRDGLVDAVAKGKLVEGRLSQAAARMVALAGGNPRTVACVDVTLPHLAPAPLP